MTEDELGNLFKEALKDPNATVELAGLNSKGQGYSGNVIFGKVILENGQNIYLVAKVSNNKSEFQDLLAIVFKKEASFYDKIVPIFDKLQADKKIKECFKFPKYYDTVMHKGKQVIVLENLKQQGFELHSKTTPLNLNHLKLTLGSYAKFHALSFVLQDQNPEIFNSLQNNIYNKEIDRSDVQEFYNVAVSNISKLLKDLGEEELLEKCLKLMEIGPGNILNNILNGPPIKKVITHGDSHSSNFLFKYKNNNKDSPSEMYMLDFQLSCINSPILDLSYHFYSVTSKTELDHFDELMDFYHQELSCFISELGCDAEKIYPKSTMIKEWKKFSVYGFIMATSFLRVFLVDDDNIPDLNDWDTFINVKTYNETAYLERLLTILKHYFSSI